MKVALSQAAPAAPLSKSLYNNGANVEFKLQVKGLALKSPLAIIFGGVTKRVQFEDLDNDGMVSVAFPASKEATVLRARLDTYDNGKEAIIQKGTVTVELLKTVSTWPHEPSLFDRLKKRMSKP